MTLGRSERGKGAITNDVLKYRKIIIESQSVSVVVYFSYIYLIVNGKSYINIFEISEKLNKLLKS